MTLPSGVAPPFLLTIQPGGAIPQNPLGGVIVRYPTWGQGIPGQRADLYFFDFAVRDWVIYGQGTVSSDGRQIIPDPGVVQPRFAWSFPGLRPILEGVIANLRDFASRIFGGKSGEPVEVATGWL